MINIYQIKASCENWHVYGTNKIETVMDNSGNSFVSVTSQWDSETVKLVKKNKPAVDNIGNLSDMLIFSPHVYERIGLFLSPFGEFQPVDCQGDSFYLCNITNELSALDQKKIEREHDLLISRFAFNYALVREQIIFKEKSEKPYKTYVTDRFVEAVIEAELTGFVFRRIWSEEQGSIAPQFPPIYENNEPRRYVGSVEIIN